jgi:Spy/CpxP family protein refolding chaperone
VSQAKRLVNSASELDITEAQRTRLLSLFKSARQHNASAADVQKQLSSILTPRQQRTLMKYINDEGDKSGDASGAGTGTGKQKDQWIA